MKFLWMIISLNVIAMGEKSFEYKRPVDRATKPYDSALRIYDKKLDRLNLGLTKEQRDLLIFKAHIFEAEEWTELDKDYLVFRAKKLPLIELKMVYPQVDGYKLKKLIEYTTSL